MGHISFDDHIQKNFLKNSLHNIAYCDLMRKLFTHGTNAIFQNFRIVYTFTEMNNFLVKSHF